MEKEEKYFSVDYLGWIDRTRRKFSDVRDIFGEKDEKKFVEWANTARYGDKISIGGVNIKCVPSDYEISKRCRFYLNF